MRHKKASHMCIFPSDGTDRIRFTGLGYQAHSQPDASGSPKTNLFCDAPIIARRRKLSSHFQREGLASQNVEVQVLHRLTGIGAAVGNHPIAVL